MGSFGKLGSFKIIFTDYQNYKGYQKSVYQIIKNQIKVTKITVNQILGNQIAGQSSITHSAQAICFQIQNLVQLPMYFYYSITLYFTQISDRNENVAQESTLQKSTMLKLTMEPCHLS